MVGKKLNSAIEKLLETIITVCLLVTVLLTLVQVVYRFILKSSLPWSQEVVMIAFVYSILFGAALAFKNLDHLTVDIFENAKPILSFIMNVISYISILSIILILIIFGASLVRDNLESAQIVGFLPIKKAYVYMALPVSGLFMLYFHLANSKKVLKWRG